MTTTTPPTLPGRAPGNDPPELHVRRMGRMKPDAVPVVMLHGAVTGSMASWWMTSAPQVA